MTDRPLPSGSTLLVNHGDSAAWFADELEARGHDARAPEPGEVIEI